MAPGKNAISSIIARLPAKGPDDAEFSRYRVLINYTYLHINRLGHLAASAVEEIYNLNAFPGC